MYLSLKPSTPPLNLLVSVFYQRGGYAITPRLEDSKYTPTPAKPRSFPFASSKTDPNTSPCQVSTQPSHRRRESGELDVFAATRYFSNEAYDFCRATKVERNSVNMCTEAKVPQRHEMTMMNNHIKEKVKLKQSSSPSAKLACFVSLFHQYYSSSKKKKLMRTLKSATTTTTNSRDSTKRSSSMNYDNYYKSCYYTSSCTKGNDELVCGDEIKLKINVKKEEIKAFKEVEDVDDGESDSSSDLFELNIYDFDLDFPRNIELPVYGGSNMGSIRKGAGFASTVAY